MVSLVHIDLGEECRSSGLRRTPLVCLTDRQRLVGFHQVVDDQLPALVVRIGTVGERVVLLRTQGGIHDERYVLVQTLQKEMPVGTEELHFGQTFRLLRIDGCIGLVEQCNGRIHT